MLQPRFELSYQLPYSGTVLRVSYARVMVTPYNENLVLSSSTGPGGWRVAHWVMPSRCQPLTPDAATNSTSVFGQAIGKHLTLDGEYFWKFTDGAFDFNVVLNTPLNFPIQFAKAKIDGATARVTLTPVRSLSAFTILGHTHSRLFSPEIGGINFGTAYAPVARPITTRRFNRPHSYATSPLRAGHGSDLHGDLTAAWLP